MMTPQQIAFIVSQLQLLIVRINEESESLEEDRMDILNSTRQRLVENMTALSSSRELYQAERLQYYFIASNYRNQYGVSINNLPIFMMGEHVERTRTVISTDGRCESRRYHFWKLEHPFLNDNDKNQVSSYRASYRMGKRAFEHLVNELSAHEEFNLVASNTIPIYIQVATVLFRLANCHIGYRQAYMLLGVSSGSYNNFTTRILKAIKDQLGYLLTWPSEPARANAIAVGFGSNTGDILNGVIGAVDGKNFIIHQPSPPTVGAMFRDRKNNYSVKLTAVCDSVLRFTYIRVGDSGRTHDAAAFRSSDIASEILRHPDNHFPDNTFMIGDSAYPLGPNLITPFPESQCVLDSRNCTFNRVHSSTRMAIERAFGVLVARWRFTSKYIYMLDQLKINEVITGCCILHNMCIDLGDTGFTDTVHVQDRSAAVPEDEEAPDVGSSSRRVTIFEELMRRRSRRGTARGVEEQL
ncbi:hypothetical protein INT47_007464 [Mucor saturninus]|uniref:DDE Tnp4 domain-containing protein n=1 Tax=Mucor saturninus TaxID=64648 RepID=A0A8H7QJS4_9FUNG|nr:hypothetical protein INT47_007464 [Mucor saturninus]